MMTAQSSYTSQRCFGFEYDDLELSTPLEWIGGWDA
jgi:hypothetical protein